MEDPALSNVPMTRLWCTPVTQTMQRSAVDKFAAMMQDGGLAP
jgi:hypothetical protein